METVYFGFYRLGFLFRAFERRHGRTLAVNGLRQVSRHTNRSIQTFKLKKTTNNRRRHNSIFCMVDNSSVLESMEVEESIFVVVMA